MQGQESRIEPDWEELSEGQIIVNKISDSSSVPGIKASFLINASRKEVWGMLTDYENFRNIYGGIDSLRVLYEDESYCRVEFYQTTLLKKINYILARNYIREGYKLGWELESGNLEIIYGSWQIVESKDPQQLLVIYTNYFRHGGIVPSRLTRNWAMRQVRDMALNARNWLNSNRALYR
jgi:hypothetical protein